MFINICKNVIIINSNIIIYGNYYMNGYLINIY